MSSPKRVSIIGFPTDLGGAGPGAALGPAAIRRTGLLKGVEALGRKARDLGDVPLPAEPSGPGDPKKRYAEYIRKACEALCEITHGTVKRGEIPVTLGGDHSLAMGSVSGVAKHFHARGQRLGLIYLDAHGDINLPTTSPTGNVHGMPLAHLLGLGDSKLARIGGFSPKVLAENTCLIGLRDVDRDEKRVIRESGVRAFTMKDVDRDGIGRVLTAAMAYAGEGTAGVHLSFDIDVVDPSIAMGTGCPSRGGLTYREAHYLMELAADSGKLVSMDMVEVNPLLDAQNHTAALACELILSALGKSIL